MIAHFLSWIGCQNMGQITEAKRMASGNRWCFLGIDDISFKLHGVKASLKNLIIDTCPRATWCHLWVQMLIPALLNSISCYVGHCKSISIFLFRFNTQIPIIQSDCLEWNMNNIQQSVYLPIIGSGMLPGQCKTIIWTNSGLLSSEPLGTIFSEIWIEI